MRFDVAFGSDWVPVDRDGPLGEGEMRIATRSRPRPLLRDAEARGQSSVSVEKWYHERVV